MQSNPNIPIAARAPPLATKKIPRAVWIGGAIGLGLLALLLCGGAGAGVLSWFNVGPMASPGGEIVGRWEPATAHQAGTVMEFKKGGTGVFESPNTFAELWKQLPKEQYAKLDAKATDAIIRNEFKWRIEQDGGPVLVIDAKEIGQTHPFLPDVKIDLMNPFFSFAGTSHSRYKREGDTLAISPVNSPQWLPGRAFRKVKTG